MESLAASALSLLTWPVVAVVRGWAVMMLWGWFVVPIFGVAQIGISAAIGLNIAVSLLTHQSMPESESGPLELYVKTTAESILLSLLAVGLGWAVSGFMP